MAHTWKMLTCVVLLLALTSCAGSGRIANEPSSPVSGPDRQLLGRTKALVQEYHILRGTTKRAWLEKCAGLLREADFTKIRVDIKSGTLSAVYNGFFAAGSMSVYVYSLGENVLGVLVLANGQVTNFAAYFINPSAILMEEFKEAVPELS